MMGNELRATSTLPRPDSVRPEASGSDGNPSSALLALEWAATQAERGDAGEVVVARRADFVLAVDKNVVDIRRYLDRVLMAHDAEAGLDAMLASGALAALLPEIEAMVGFGDGEWRHKDVWKHTKQVVRQAVPRLEIRWAALLHDIGKLKTRSISESGEVHFFGHAEVGARMFDRMNRRLPVFRNDDALRESVRFLILHHLRANQYEPSWTDSAVRRFTKEMGDSLENLLCLSRADITTKRPEKKKKGLRQISDLADRVAQVREMDSVVPPLPSGIGDVIMHAFKLPPSRTIGLVKKALEDAVEKGEVQAHQPAEFYVELLRKEPGRFGLPSA